MTSIEHQPNTTIEAGLTTVRFISVEWRARRDRTARVYFEHEAENMLDNFGNRHARPTDIYRRIWAEHVLPAIPELGDVGPLRWSVKAGCSMCPCSPGFTTRSQVFADGRRCDVFVTVRAECPRTNNPDLADTYKAQLCAATSQSEGSDRWGTRSTATIPVVAR